MNSHAAAEDFGRRLLRLDTGVEKIIDAAAENPDSAIVQLCAAAFYLYGQTADCDAMAETHLREAARTAAPGRESMLLEALSHWQRREFFAALAGLEEITSQWPDDLLSAKFAEFLYYVLGQQHLGERFLAHMQRIGPANANDPDYLGMLAFAHELCGHFGEARASAEKSLAIVSRNPWAQHALTHVLIREGLVEEGRSAMEKFLPELKTCGRPIYCHDAWHLGLLCLEELDYTGAEQVLREHVWGIVPGMVGEQIDAIALGWRMEMAGYRVDTLWNEVAPHIEARALECFMPFLNAHHAYALARAGRNDVLEALFASVDARADHDDEESRHSWAGAGRAIVRAGALHGAGRNAECAETLEAILPDLTRVGGSDAQDDLFRQMYFNALAAGGRKSEARAYWEKFSGTRLPTPLDREFYSRT